MYLSTKQTFKAIARFIRQHILKNHRKCIKLFHKSRIDGKFRVYSLAYIKWRKEVEAITNIWMVESGDCRNTGVELDNKYKNFSTYYRGGLRKYLHEVLSDTYKPFLLEF